MSEEQSDRPVARALLAAIAASSNDAIIGKDLDGIITVWNEGAERLFGFAAADMVGRPITTIIPPERIDEETTILAKMRRGERIPHFETERLNSSGRAIPVSLTISPIRDDTGRIIGVSKVARDLSELHRLNRELARHAALLQSILDTVSDALVVIDRAGIVHSFSPAAERMFGFTAEEVVGRNVSLLMPPSQASGHDGHMQRYVATRERRIIGIGRVLVGQRKDGSSFPMELRVGEVEVPGSHLFTGFMRDLTERQDRERRLNELQAELIHVSRLSELGQMVSALAHEVNQPLTAMTNYISGIRRLLAGAELSPLARAVDKVAEQAERASGIVQSLRGLVRKESRPRQTEDLETMIQETSALALIGTSRLVNLELRIGADATHAVVDKVQIQQVLLNLMRNAVEAMAGSPRRRLTIATARRGDRIEVRIADTGPGLSPEVAARLFMPFVTTKAEGLGVGLSICRTIVEAHGGRLVADSPAGGGAAFRFTLPGPDAARAD